jgi:glucose-1-phosphate thymidylyltransferase
VKGIILAGGVATRMFPTTQAVSKQLLPVYDKPMIYYPLSTLMLAGIRDILVICRPDQRTAFESLLGDGGQWGLSLDYATQPEPGGIAQALLIGRDFIGGRRCALILGDNIFYGQNMGGRLRTAARRRKGAVVFCKWVQNPERYGVMEFEPDGTPQRIIEKPKRLKSNWAVTGIYFLDGRAADIAAGLKPSRRGELEITDVNNAYLKEGALSVERLGRGTAWLDAGTHDALFEAASLVRTVQSQQGFKIACLEEVSYRMGFIDAAALRRLARKPANAMIRDYLLAIEHDDSR